MTNKIYTDWDNNPFFKAKEFVCKCGKCKQASVSLDLIEKLTQARKLSGIPFIITSGCRCLEHNQKEAGSPNSDHLTTEDIICTGADISCTRDSERYKIISALYNVGITRIGLSKTFIHAGTNQKNQQNITWFY